MGQDLRHRGLGLVADMSFDVKTLWVSGIQRVVNAMTINVRERHIRLCNL